MLLRYTFKKNNKNDILEEPGPVVLQFVKFCEIWW